jgi:hypothetical protein
MLTGIKFVSKADIDKKKELKRQSDEKKAAKEQRKQEVQQQRVDRGEVSFLQRTLNRQRRSHEELSFTRCSCCRPSG